MNFTTLNTQKKDLTAIARVHIAAFPDSLSSALGVRYVAKMLEWFLSTDKTFLYFIASDKGEVIGYCGGIIKDGTLKTGSSSGMLQHSFNQAIIGLITHPWLLFHPELTKKYKFLLRNIYTRFLGNKPKSDTPNNIKEPVTARVGLVIIGVHPAFFGSGAAGALLQHFDVAARSHNISHLYLTVNKNNGRAIKAYEKFGWSRATLEQDNLLMTKLISL